MTDDNKTSAVTDEKDRDAKTLNDNLVIGNNHSDDKSEGPDDILVEDEL